MANTKGVKTTDINIHNTRNKDSEVEMDVRRNTVIGKVLNVRYFICDPI